MIDIIRLSLHCKYFLFSLMTPLFPIIEGDEASVRYLIAHCSEYTLRFIRATLHVSTGICDSLGYETFISPT